MEEANASKCETNIHVEPENEKQAPEFENPDDVPDENAQDGVKIAEAMTLSWSRSSLIVVYIRQVVRVSSRAIPRTFWARFQGRTIY
jgi:hypothetical protein